MSSNTTTLNLPVLPSDPWSPKVETEGLYGEDLAHSATTMYQPSHSLHSFVKVEHQTRKQIFTSKEPSKFKEEPCWLHLLNHQEKCMTLDTCSWMDILCPGQHPKETRDFINEARRSQGREDLDSEVLIFSEADKDQQLRICEQETFRLGWSCSPAAFQPRRPSSDGKSKKKFGTSPLRVVHHQIRHSSSEEYIALRSEVVSLRAQLSLRLNDLRNRFSQSEHKAMAELLTRNAVLETEMEHYRVYMATTTARNQKEKKKMMKTIHRMERQLRETVPNACVDDDV
jgi:hypothetical protein